MIKQVTQWRVLWTEFRPTFHFVGLFLVVFIVGNVVYGLFVSYFDPEPDPLTILVTKQSSSFLNLIGFETTTFIHSSLATISILNKGRAIVSVYEGCNGVNIMVVFLAFLIAFPKPARSPVRWVGFLGCILIHLINVMRIDVLFGVAFYYPEFLYIYHKYIFTATIYGIVFLLWLLWVRWIFKQPIPNK